MGHIVTYAAQRSRPLLFRLTPRTRLFAARSALLRLAGYDVARSAQCVSTVEFHSPHVSLGEGSFCAHQVRFYGGPGSQISIGNNVEVGPETIFVARSHHLGPSQHRAGASKDTQILVEDGVWIGARVVVVGPCRIGEGAVIAAGSCVRDDIPANVVSFGHGQLPDRPLGDRQSGGIGEA